MLLMLLPCLDSGKVERFSPVKKDLMVIYPVIVEIFPTRETNACALSHTPVT